jgi:hypothetical protein
MALHPACGGVILPDPDGIHSQAENAWVCECGDCPLCGDKLDGETVELWGDARGHWDCAEAARQQEARP